MKNKTVANWLIGAIGLAFFTALIEDSLTVNSAEAMYILAGLGMVVFGIWAIVKLYKLEDK